MTSLSGRLVSALAVSLAVCAICVPAHAKKAKYTVLYSFGGDPDGRLPAASPTLDAKGTLYGTTNSGGSPDEGTIYRLPKRGSETLLHTFAGGAADGRNPNAPLTADANGNLYGTTFGGGPSDAGTVFKITPSGAVTILYSFTGGSDGGNPQAPVVLDEDGSLYGTTDYGGDATCSCGVVFKLDPQGNETVLHAFLGSAASDGADPGFAGLVRDGAGNLYGTTTYGGSTYCDQGCGIVFQISPQSGYELLYGFFGHGYGGHPYSGLAIDAKGTLYGTTLNSGSGCDCGIVFSLTFSNKKGLVPKTLYSFTGGGDGGYPAGLPILDRDGNLYGTTMGGGAGGAGVVYKMSPKGKETVLHAFAGGSDGLEPIGGLSMDDVGTLYGTTAFGGNMSGSCAENGGCGLLFKIQQ